MKIFPKHFGAFFELMILAPFIYINVIFNIFKTIKFICKIRSYNRQKEFDMIKNISLPKWPALMNLLKKNGRNEN